MSFSEAPAPDSSEPGSPALASLISARPRDLGGIGVGRVLPAAARRSVGPFVFLDHMGPSVLEAGHGVDVGPHPHIGLATVTYLFAGEVVHRDSLGSEQLIRPGDINWMTAGRGIAHSERTPAAARTTGGRVHGLQLWVALPTASEESEPAFHHHPARALPELDDGGIRLRVLVGSAYGAVSPVATFSPLFYVEATLPAGARLALPAEHAERAVFVVEGRVAVAEAGLGPDQLGVFTPGAAPPLVAEAPSRIALLGGAPLEGPRHIWWNFVSSSKARIEQAARDWQAGSFPRIPGDDGKLVPLPEWPKNIR